MFRSGLRSVPCVLVFWLKLAVCQVPQIFKGKFNFAVQIHASLEPRALAEQTMSSCLCNNRPSAQGSYSNYKTTSDHTANAQKERRLRRHMHQASLKSMWARENFSLIAAGAHRGVTKRF